MPKYKLTIEVIDILGEGICSMEQKIGEKYNYPEDRGKMCPSAFHIMYPMIVAMGLGATHDSFEDDGHSTTVGCANHKHQVVYKIQRHIVED
jgi:uncharacterized repeat protein (TIGR04076 family)